MVTLPLDVEFPVHKNYRLVDWGGGSYSGSPFIRTNGKYYESIVLSSASAGKNGFRFAGGLTLTTRANKFNILYDFLI